MSRGDKELIDALLRTLKGQGPGGRHERSVAAIRLGQMGERRALTEILRHLGDREDLVAVSACYASWQIDGEVRSLERMVAALASPDEEIMQLAVVALTGMGEAVVEDLKEISRRGSPYAGEIARILEDIEDREG